MSLFDWIGTAHAAGETYVDLPTVDLFGSGPSLAGIANAILGLLLSLAYPLALAAFFYSAYLLLVSGGKPDAIGAVKKNIIYVTMGLALLIFATVILRFVLSLFTWPAGS